MAPVYSNHFVFVWTTPQGGSTLASTVVVDAYWSSTNQTSNDVSVELHAVTKTCRTRTRTRTCRTLLLMIRTDL